MTSCACSYFSRSTCSLRGLVFYADGIRRLTILSCMWFLKRSQMGPFTNSHSNSFFCISPMLSNLHPSANCTLACQYFFPFSMWFQSRLMCGHWFFSKFQPQVMSHIVNPLICPFANHVSVSSALIYIMFTQLHRVPDNGPAYQGFIFRPLTAPSTQSPPPFLSPKFKTNKLASNSVTIPSN